ncbi:MAG: Ig-like domain-containing protein [Myxococcota bacterium]
MPIKTDAFASASSPLRALTLCAFAGLAAGCFSPPDSALDEDEADNPEETTAAETSAGDPSDAGGTTGAPDPDDPDASETTDDGDGPDDPDTTTGEDDPGDETSDDETSGDETSGDQTSGDQTSGTPGDIPSILDISPADGEAGVYADSTITIQFSEPMDQAATQAAYQSADLPAAAVTFDWNAAGDTLTITPNAPLDYAEGTSPASTDALPYTFTISTAAESELGEGLPDDTEVTFTTLRRLSESFEDDPNLSGRVRDLAGATLLAGSYLLGDNTNNDVARGFVTFDIASIADGAVEIEDATLHARWSQQVGNPFVDLGAVLYQHVQYDAFNDALFDVPGIGSAAGLFGTAAEDEVDRDVTDIAQAVLDDDATYEQRVQFRMLWFISETDGDSSSDGVTLIASDLGLALTYLAP